MKAVDKHSISHFGAIKKYDRIEKRTSKLKTPCTGKVQRVRKLLRAGKLKATRAI